MTKNSIHLVFFCIPLLFTAYLGYAGAEETASSGARPVICAISSFYECSFEKGCEPRTAAELNAPQFLKIMIDKKQIVPIGRDPEDTHTSTIQNLSRIDGMIILQGMEDGDPDKVDGVGWTISIDEKTGKMVITASGHKVGFAGMGACSAY